MPEEINPVCKTAPGDIDANNAINKKLREIFDGKIVRKDLTKKIREGANVPVYVLGALDKTISDYHGGYTYMARK